jgi:hypothetical protein
MARKTQIQHFRDTARAIQCDEDEDHFNEILGKVARAMREPEEVAKLRDEIANAKGNLPPHPKKPRR